MVVYWALLTSVIILAPVALLVTIVYSIWGAAYAVGLFGLASERLAQLAVSLTRPAWPLAYVAVPVFGLVSLTLAVGGRGFAWVELAFVCLFASFVGFMVWATKRRAAGGRVSQVA